jgi:hypothetical protein
LLRRSGVDLPYDAVGSGSDGVGQGAVGQPGAMGQRNAGARPGGRTATPAAPPAQDCSAIDSDGRSCGRSDDDLAAWLAMLAFRSSRCLRSGARDARAQELAMLAPRSSLCSRRGARDARDRRARQDPDARLRAPQRDALPRVAVAELLGAMTAGGPRYQSSPTRSWRSGTRRQSSPTRRAPGG